MFTFRVPIKGDVKFEAVSGEYRDEINIKKVSIANPAYKLAKKIANGGNWT